MLFFIKLAIAAVLTFALSWLPLVGAYNYEAALLIALIGVIFVPIITPRYDADKRAWLLKALGATTLVWLFTNLASLGVAAIRQELCDPASGLNYALLISLPSTWLATALWGWATRLGRFKAVHVIVYVFIVLLDLVLALVTLYQWPPLVTFGQFFGYFAGSIYDEAIRVTPALCAYRVGTLLVMIALIAAQAGTPRWRRKLIGAAIALTIALSWHVGLSQLGILPPMGRAELHQTLWATLEAPDHAYTVHFMPRSKALKSLAEEKQAYSEEFARDFEALTQFFNATPRKPIDIWLYPSVDVKAHFLAARRTSFARVWKHEIHLVDEGPHSSVPRHEMAHLFAESFGNAPLGLAGAHGVPVMGWVEGLAMAAEWSIDEFDLHTWSAAILNAPDLAPAFHEITPTKLFYGFWTLPSPIAYTLAGSFVHWLIEHYGIDQVKVLSQQTPGGFEDILQVPLDDAFAAWKVDLAQHHRNARADALAAIKFGRSSIFAKTCARFAAAKESAFYRCLTDQTCSEDALAQCLSGDDNDFLGINAIKSDTPLTVRDLEHDWQYLMMRGIADDAESRTHLMTRLNTVDRSAWTPSEKLVWQEREADLLWYAGLPTIAAIQYSAMLTQTLPRSVVRRLEIKRQAAFYAQMPVSNAIRQWFAATSAEERELLYNQFDHAPIMAWLELVNALESRQNERALHAFIQYFINAATDQQAARPTAAIQKDLWFAF